MKANKVIVAVEELEARLMRDISQKVGNSQRLKSLLARGALVNKADFLKLEKKYQSQLKQMRLEIDEIRAQMITREILKKWEAKIKKRLIVYTCVQLAMCVMFFVLL